MALTQAESYADLWAAHRDQSRPLSPADVWALREDREFQAPSRGHVKRLQRERPTVVVSKPRPVLDNSRRREINQAASHGSRIAAMLGYVKPIIR